jgi:hypothetical protein
MAATWLASATSSDVNELLALRPELAELRQKLLDRLWGERLVEPVALELCRLRIASMVGDDEALAIRTPHAVAAGLTEGQVSALTNWATDPQFTAAHRAAIGAAELFVIDVRSMNADEPDGLKEHFTADERYAMLIGFALFDGFGRMRRVFKDDGSN